MDENSFQMAALKLRANLGMSQQAMATSLGLSMGAVRNYESGAVDPEARAAVAYLLAAEADGRPRMLGLMAVFVDAVERALGVPIETLARVNRRVDLHKCVAAE